MTSSAVGSNTVANQINSSSHRALQVIFTASRDASAHAVGPLLHEPSQASPRSTGRSATKSPCSLGPATREILPPVVCVLHALEREKVKPIFPVPHNTQIRQLGSAPTASAVAYLPLQFLSSASLLRYVLMPQKLISSSCCKKIDLLIYRLLCLLNGIIIIWIVLYTPSSSSVEYSFRLCHANNGIIGTGSPFSSRFSPLLLLGRCALSIHDCISGPQFMTVWANLCV